MKRPYENLQAKVGFEQNVKIIKAELHGVDDNISTIITRYGMKYMTNNVRDRLDALRKQKSELELELKQVSME